MNAINPAEIVLAKQFFSPFEFDVLLRDPESFKKELMNRVLNEIRRLIKESGKDSPPFDPESLFSFRKVKETIIDENLPFGEAMLTPVLDGFVIKLAPQESKTRVRFSIAHELGHTFFYDYNSCPPKKLYKSVSSNRSEEMLANIIASEILAPEPFLHDSTLEIIKNLSVEHPSSNALNALNALKKLKEKFNVSFHFLIIKLLYVVHRWNKDIWKDDLWEAFIITCEVARSKVKISYFRSPGYKYKLKGILKKDVILEIINKVLNKKKGEYNKKLTKKTNLTMENGRIEIYVNKKIKYQGEASLVRSNNSKLVILLIMDSKKE